MCPIIGYNGTNIVPIIGQISRVDLYGIVCVDQMQTQYYSSPSMPERERGAGPIWWLVIIFATILFPILRRRDLAKNIVC